MNDHNVNEVSIHGKTMKYDGVIVSISGTHTAEVDKNYIKNVVDAIKKVDPHIIKIDLESD